VRQEIQQVAEPATKEEGVPMNRSSLVRLILTACLCEMLCGCATTHTSPPPLSPMARAAMQTKELSGDSETAYRATISVLQDQGWQVQVADKDGGLIQASSTRGRDVIGPEDDYRSSDELIRKTRAQVVKFKGDKHVAPAIWTRWQRVTAVVEPWGDGRVRERLTIVNCGSLPSGLHYYPYPRAFGYASHEVLDSAQEQSVVVENPKTYQLLFQQIQKAIFIRQGLSGD
jgi:hypothetical protein